MCVPWLFLRINDGYKSRSQLLGMRSNQARHLYSATGCYATPGVPELLWTARSLRFNRLIVVENMFGRCYRVFKENI